jgi:hypothetical protein
MRLAEHLDVFFGRSSEAVTQVYLRIKGPFRGDSQLAGSIAGPYCRHTRTLATKVAFTAARPGTDLLAQATVPDLCNWSLDQPHLYRLHAELRRSGQVVDSVDWEWGARRLGQKGSSLFWEAKRWVLRGVSQALLEAPLAAWRESRLTMLVENPPEDLCSEASREGVPLVAVVRDASNQLPQRIRQLSRWPAVMLVLLETRPGDINLQELAPNLLFACWADEHPPADEARALFCPANSPKIARLGPTSLLPVIAVGEGHPVTDLEQGRAQCDALQRDLAAIGQFAGYVAGDSGMAGWRGRNGA